MMEGVWYDSSFSLFLSYLLYRFAHTFQFFFSTDTMAANPASKRLRDALWASREETQRVLADFVREFTSTVLAADGSTLTLTIPNTTSITGYNAKVIKKYLLTEGFRMVDPPQTDSIQTGPIEELTVIPHETSLWGTLMREHERYLDCRRPADASVLERYKKLFDDESIVEDANKLCAFLFVIEKEVFENEIIMKKLVEYMTELGYDALSDPQRIDQGKVYIQVKPREAYVMSEQYSIAALARFIAGTKTPNMNHTLFKLMCECPGVKITRYNDNWEVRAGALTVECEIKKHLDAPEIFVIFPQPDFIGLVDRLSKNNYTVVSETCRRWDGPNGGINVSCDPDMHGFPFPVRGDAVIIALFTKDVPCKNMLSSLIQYTTSKLILWVPKEEYDMLTAVG